MCNNIKHVSKKQLKLLKKNISNLIILETDKNDYPLN